MLTSVKLISKCHENWSHEWNVVITLLLYNQTFNLPSISVAEKENVCRKTKYFLVSKCQLRFECRVFPEYFELKDILFE